MLKIESPNFLRNTAGISSVEFFWGIGMPVLIESTFLQLFLRSLGASYFLIGLLPVFLGLSIPVFSLISAYVSASLKSKRRSVVLYHMSAALPVALFGWFLLVFINTAVEKAGGKLSREESETFRTTYRKNIEEGDAECPAPTGGEGEKKMGRLKRSKARNLLKRLIDSESEVLRCMDT